jgi:hypothetical protein
MLDKIKGYKTVAFNLAIAVAGVLFGDEAVQALTALGLSSDAAIDALVALWASGNVALRAITNTPIFKGES